MCMVITLTSFRRNGLGTPGQHHVFERWRVRFKEDVGIRLHGNTTRSRPRKSIRVCSRSNTAIAGLTTSFPDKQVDVQAYDSA